MSEIQELLAVEIRRRPYQHQIEALHFFEHKPDNFLFWEMGTGKSGGAILLARLRCFQEKKVLKILILTPIVTISNWKNEFYLFSRTKSQDILALTDNGNKKKIERLSTENPTVVIINYDALISDDIVNALLKFKPDILICDEAHMLKNHTASRTRNTLKISKIAKYKILLSGTPILNSVKDIFSPFNVLDNGATFGTNAFIFQNTYMIDKNMGFKHKHNYFPNWVPREDKFKELNEKIYKKAMRKLKSECLKLPPLIETTVPIEWGKDQKVAYDQMKRDFITFVQQDSDKPKAVVAQLAMTKALRLMQIASGFVTTDNGETVRFKEVPRLKKLEEDLLELVTDHKVIVWCAFKENYKMIEEVCKRNKIECVFLTGEQTTKEKDHAIESFHSDIKIRVMVANRRAGGIGVNLIASDYSIVYSRNFSLADEEQSKARNYRSGSEIHSTIIKADYAIPESIDADCLTALRNKQDLSETILNYRG